MDTVLEMGGGTSDKDTMNSYGFDLNANSHIKLDKIINQAYIEIEKKNIKADFSLSCSKYISGSDSSERGSKFQILELHEIASIRKGSPITKKDALPGKIPVIAGGISYSYTHNQANRDANVITVSASGANAGYIGFYDQPIFASDCTTIEKKDQSINIKYLYYVLKSQQEIFFSLQQGGAQPHVYSKDFQNIKIPLPSLSIQKEIAEELDRYQKIIDGAKQVVENYIPSFEVNQEGESATLGELCTLVRGSSPRPKGDPRYYGGDVPRLMVSDLTRDGMYVTPMKDFLTKEGAKLSRSMKKGDVVMAVSGNPGLPAILTKDASIHDGFVGFRNLDPKILPEFLYFVLFKNKKTNNSKSVGAVFKNLTTAQVKNFSIPTPPLEIQKKIVSDLQSEMEAIQTNKKLIVNFTRKISDKIESIWNG
jgi:restriction endonuclease S subunit